MCGSASVLLDQARSSSSCQLLPFCVMTHDDIDFSKSAYQQHMLSKRKSTAGKVLMYALTSLSEKSAFDF